MCSTEYKCVYALKDTESYEKKANFTISSEDIFKVLLHVFLLEQQKYAH